MDNNVEILQVSSLEDYNWPALDPHSIPQRTRSILKLDIELVMQCVNNASIDKEAFLKNVVRKENLSQVDAIMKLLAHRKFQMNPAGEVFKEKRWKKCIEKAINKNEPIDIVYPQFCVIPNAPKRYTNLGSAAGEDSTIELFKLINEHVKWFHEPGVRFHALADASLYASAFQRLHRKSRAEQPSLQIL